MVSDKIENNLTDYARVKKNGESIIRKYYKKHIILTAKHPSPLSANKGGFFGCKHFSKCNEILKKKNSSNINLNLSSSNRDCA